MSKIKDLNNPIFKEKKIFRNENEYGLNDEHVEAVINSSKNNSNVSETLKSVVKEEDQKFLEKMENEDEQKVQDYIRDTEVEKFKRAKEQNDLAMDMLSGQGYSSYKANVAEYGMWILMNKYFSNRYDYHVVPTKKGHINIYNKTFNSQEGLIAVLKDNFTGDVYIKAMGLMFDPEIDVRALQLLCVEVENTVDALDKKLISTQKGESTSASGIITGA